MAYVLGKARLRPKVQTHYHAYHSHSSIQLEEEQVCPILLVGGRMVSLQRLMRFLAAALGRNSKVRYLRQRCNDEGTVGTSVTVAKVR